MINNHLSIVLLSGILFGILLGGFMGFIIGREVENKAWLRRIDRIGNHR